MAAIKNFFEKRRLQARFKLAGRGKRLTDDESGPSQQSVQYSQAPPRSKVVTEESRRAGAAALARFDYNQQQMPTMANRSQQVIRAEALKELAAEKAALHSNKMETRGEVVQDSAPVLTVNGVYFKCALVTSDLLSKSEMQKRIEEFLYQQLAEDKEVTPCYMIRTLNSKEKAKNCVETLAKYLENIYEHPTEAKYQKIRLKNRVFQEKVSGLKGAHEFLLAAGFEFKQLPTNDEGNTEDFYVFCTDKLAECRRMFDILQTTEPITPELDRNVKVLTITDESSGRIELPSDFYNLTAEDLKREQQLKSELVERNMMLRTKAMREREEMRETRRYKYTLLRIRFPNGVILQGTFSVNEKLSNVQDFIRESLVNDWQPFLLTTSTGTHLTEGESTLLQLKLVPAAVIHFAWDPEVVMDLKRETGMDSDEFLSEEMMTLLENLSISN